jgi:hypothetical protein
LKRKLVATYQWYFDHLIGLTDVSRVFLLTDSVKSRQDYLQFLKNDQKTGVITMEDFITINSSRHPELVNYMGFAQDIDIEDEKMTDLT